MAKLTLAELKARRDEKKKEMVKREEGKTTQIIIGMGTCGIAAGAKDAFDAFLDEIDARGLVDVAVTQTGCMGLCYKEPTVEVIMPDMPHIIYGEVSGEFAKRIIAEHIVERKIIGDHVLDKPAADILK